jgi:hypothetical protein
MHCGGGSEVSSFCNYAYIQSLYIRRQVAGCCTETHFYFILDAGPPCGHITRTALDRCRPLSAFFKRQMKLKCMPLAFLNYHIKARSTVKHLKKE